MQRRYPSAEHGVLLDVLKHRHFFNGQIISKVLMEMC